MQTALHQYARAAKLHRLANLFVDGVQIEDVPFLGRRPLERPIECAEGAILRAEVGVIDVAVDDVSHRALGMHLAANRVRLHANPNQIIGPKHLQSLLLSQRHPSHSKSRCYFIWLKPWKRVSDWRAKANLSYFKKRVPKGSPS